MKRDMDLIRSILLQIEESDACDGLNGITDIRVDGYSHEYVSYHVQLLEGSGLIKAREMGHRMWGDRAIIDWFVASLTWEGHEFLDAARNDERWKQAKAVADKAGGLSFEVFKGILVKLGAEFSSAYLRGQIPGIMG